MPGEDCAKLWLGYGRAVSLRRWAWRVACRLQADAVEWRGLWFRAVAEAVQEYWLYGEAYLLNMEQQMSTALQHRKELERKAAIREWRDRMGLLARKGKRDAYRFIKEYDVPGGVPIESLGTGQVLAQEQEKWSRLLDVGGTIFDHRRMLKEAQSRGLPGATLGLINVEDIRAAARSFPGGTSCPDGAPARLFAGLSDGALQGFAMMATSWINNGVGPRPSPSSILC